MLDNFGRNITRKLNKSLFELNMLMFKEGFRDANKFTNTAVSCAMNIDKIEDPDKSYGIHNLKTAVWFVKLMFIAPLLIGAVSITKKVLE